MINDVTAREPVDARDEDEDSVNADTSELEGMSETEEGGVVDEDEGDEAEAEVSAREEEALSDAVAEDEAMDGDVEDEDPVDVEESDMIIDHALKLRILEATIFASGEPVTTEMLKRQLGEGVNVAGLLSDLKDHYVGRGVQLVENDGRWSFRTAADVAPYMKITRQPRRKLPRAASEVLAIIAYHQPVTRADIESIRGVDTSKGTLDILLELGWVRPGKRRDTPGRPLTWHTTDDFLSHFNLETLKDLPGLEELKAAGLLDARPIMAHLPREQDDVASDVPDEDAEFVVWEADEADNDTKVSAAG